MTVGQIALTRAAIILRLDRDQHSLGSRANPKNSWAWACAWNCYRE